ncbi:MAG: signal peptidase II [Myxococcales bacterium]|nr:signal peptidase II [Myxococcales bacterium]MCB9524502.1 signal peptidase II [Myxococcales bacterium]
MPRHLPFLAWASFAFSADQWSKWAAVRLLVEGPLPREPAHILSGTWPVTDAWLNLRVGGNRGAAMGLAGELPPLQHGLLFAGVAVIAVAVVWFLYRRAHGHRALQWGLALMLGGSLGNLVDRVNHGYVVDFLQITAGASALPTFNLADVAIAVGAVLLLLDARRLGRPRGEPPRAVTAG